MMCRGIHKKHTQQHDMTGNASGLCVMDFYGSFRPNLVPLDIEEVDIMGTHVDDGEEQDRISALAVKPLRLIQREKLEFRSNES